MGSDKARLELDGVVWVRRVAGALTGAGASRVAVIGGDDTGLAGLGLALVADRWPGQGPLGGLLTALRWSSEEIVVVAGCDQPWLDPTTLSALVAGLTGEDRAEAALASLDGRLQPLPGAYRRRSAPSRQAAFDAGHRALESGLAGVIEVPGLDPARLRDADSPADLNGDVQFWAEHLAKDGPVELPEIDIDELARRRQDGGALVDVRQPDEYVEGHVPGAQLIPLGEVPDRFGQIPSDGQVLVICKSGGRSLRAVEFLRAQGVDAVNVAGGTQAWIDSGHPTVTGEFPT